MGDSTKSRQPDVFGSSRPSIDPAATGQVVRWAFGLEAIANVFGGVAMIAYPSSILSLAVATPIRDINSTSVTLMQWLGALVLGLTPQLVLGIANTRSAIESRPMIYWCLLSGEGFLIPLFVWQATAPGNVGFTPKALVVCAATLVAPVIWRLYVLFVKPDWMGRWFDRSHTKSQ